MSNKGAQIYLSLKFREELECGGFQHFGENKNIPGGSNHRENKTQENPSGSLPCGFLGRRRRHVVGLGSKGVRGWTKSVSHRSEAPGVSPANTNKQWFQPWFESGAGVCPIDSRTRMVFRVPKHDRCCRGPGLMFGWALSNPDQPGRTPYKAGQQFVLIASPLFGVQKVTGCGYVLE